MERHNHTTDREGEDYGLEVLCARLHALIDHPVKMGT